MVIGKYRPSSLNEIGTLQVSQSSIVDLRGLGTVSRVILLHDAVQELKHDSKEEEVGHRHAQGG